MGRSSIFQFLILCIFLHSAIYPVTCSNNSMDLLALLDFRDNVMDPRGVLASWQLNGTVHYCNWRGVSCGSRHRDRVVSIHLESQGLVGSLSPHLGNLSFLRSINLRNNSFNGLIPQEFGYLRRIGYIELSNNSFQGEIPRNLSHCLNLHYLNLIDNNLTGEIPQEFSTLVRMEHLGLGTNRLSGTIPSFIGNFSDLRSLYLGECRFHGRIPESFSRLQNLRLFNLDDNRLHGTIPSGIFNITSIQTFSLDSNLLHGTIPSDIGFTLPNMRFVSVGYNNFTGSIPNSLSNASSLYYIGFFANNFTGPMPKNLGKLSRLRNIGVWSTHVEDDIGSFISSLTNCTSLENIDIFDNFLTGAIPDAFSNFSSRLRSVEIGFNQLNGPIPVGIGNLIGLTLFASVLSGLSGSIPSTIGRLSIMQELNLGGNRLTGELPSSLGNLTMLNTLFLVENNFLGAIPSSLGNCSRLLVLDLSENNLIGTIPREIMSISSLSRYLDMSRNSLTGTIPYEVGSLTNLGGLDFSNNMLSGQVPSSLSNCISLQRLHLKSNSFQGEISPFLTGLNGLQDLDLSDNNFSGPIPSFLGRIQLIELNISFNSFRGPVPAAGVFGNESAVSLQGNTELCGGISVMNLPPCPLAHPRRRNSHTLLKVLVPIACSGVIFVMVILCSYRRVQREKKIRRNTNIPSFESKFQRLSYWDLQRATNGFSESSIIGSGRFGSVYKGFLNDGTTLIAVKVLNLHIRGAFKTFKSECNVLKIARHRNLLKILSIAVTTDFKGNDFTALVYEFQANGSLEQWLHQNNQEQDGNVRYITLMQRLDIAIDIASGLEYLHNGTESVIVHGDLKPSNILLDLDMVAYIGDFGLAKVISSVSNSSFEESTSTSIKGTIGYIAPEYGMNGVLSTQGDVYSYGILLLELFTNIRPSSDALSDNQTLHNFVRNALTDNAMDIIDPLILQRERNSINANVMDCIITILQIGVKCSMELQQDRLSMTETVIELKRVRTVCAAQRSS